MKNRSTTKDKGNKDLMGGHLDTRKHGPMESAPATGSRVPARKLITSKHPYKRLQNNPDTAIAADHARDTSGNVNGDDVIAAQE